MSFADHWTPAAPPAPVKPGESGALAEGVAARYVERQGLTIIARNYRTRFGEIDLIAMDRDVVVFIEVRMRREGQQGSRGGGVGSITTAKCKRITRAAQSYLQRYDIAPMCRFDVIALNASSHVETWLKNAFEASTD